jgi:hypothetical protein
VEKKMLWACGLSGPPLSRWIGEHPVYISMAVVKSLTLPLGSCEKEFPDLSKNDTTHRSRAKAANG